VNMRVLWKSDAQQRTIKLRTLTLESFAPFGHVIQIGQEPVPANGGTARRHDVGDVLISSRPQAKLYLSVFECEAQHLPLRIEILERHASSAQTITPMQADQYIVVVCLDDGAGHPDLSTLHAFQGGTHQGVNYNPGIWHHGIIALDRRSLFFVQSWQDGSASDCEEAIIPPFYIELSTTRGAP
jgi:ureidoglycolate lyase